jgi:hypothetical protein
MRVCHDSRRPPFHLHSAPAGAEPHTDLLIDGPKGLNGTARRQHDLGSACGGARVSPDRTSIEPRNRAAGSLLQHLATRTSGVLRDKVSDVVNSSLERDPVRGARASTIVRTDRVDPRPPSPSARTKCVFPSSCGVQSARGGAAVLARE